MPKQIQKSLQDCLSKIKASHKQMQFPLRSCKHPKTPSFSIAAGKDKGSDAATLSDIDKFLFENFRSLYQKEYEEETSKTKGGASAGKTTAFLLESPRLLDFPPPENLCRSARFFVAAGSSSSLIMEEAPPPPFSSTSASGSTNSSSPTTSTEEEAEDNKKGNESPTAPAPDDFIALLTYSPSPYEDFRRSMLEMVEARVEHNGKVDWEFLEELLFCYLDLNNKKAYRFILRAFVDLTVVLRENAGRIPVIRPPLNSRRQRRQLN